MKYTLAIVALTSAISLDRWAQATQFGDGNPHPGYPAGQDGFSGVEGIGSYARETPAIMGGPGSGDDQFQYSMVANYAMEKSTPEGKPTGEFVFRPVDARVAALEILDTHMGLKGQAAQDYLDANFDKTFAHFDTANEGVISADRMSGFFRYLTGNMQINLH